MMQNMGLLMHTHVGTHTLTEAGRASVGEVLQLYQMIWSGSFHLKVRVKDGERFGGDAEMKTERLRWREGKRQRTFCTHKGLIPVGPTGIHPIFDSIF